MSLLLETSFQQLLNRTVSAFPDTTRRQHAVDSVSLQSVTLVPAEGALIAKGVVRGSGGKLYAPVIEFDQVVYDPDEGQAAVTFSVDGTQYTISPITKQSVDVKVTCTCMDFKFRFAQYNNTDGSLHGDVPPLYAKQSGSNRGPANPTKSPGVCKHIIELADSIEQSGLMV